MTYCRRKFVKNCAIPQLRGSSVVPHYDTLYVTKVYFVNFSHAAALPATVFARSVFPLHSHSDST